MWIFFFAVQERDVSHAPGNWTLSAELALEEAMLTMGFNYFTIARSQAAAHGFEGCAEKSKFIYMANAINSSDRGMPGLVNCQAVVSKIKKLQTQFGSDADGFLGWRVSLQEKKFVAGRQSASEAEAQARRKARRDEAEARAKEAFGPEDLNAIAENKDKILAFIQLLETDNQTMTAVLESLIKFKGDKTVSLALVESVFKAHAQLGRAGEENLLPKVLSAIALHGDNIEEWPVMIQTMYDFAMVLSAEDPRGIRWSKETKDRFGWHYIKGGKQMVDSIRGYGWSNANPDDDAGTSSREKQRKQSLAGQGEEEAGAGTGDAEGKQAGKKRPRFNLLGPSRRTLQRHIQKEAQATEKPGIFKQELESFTEAVVAAGQDAGIITLAFDKVQIAPEHPGDGCSGEGETDCGGLLPGAGMDLAERQAWLADRQADVTLQAGNMGSTEAILAWYKRVVQARGIIYPMLEKASAEHQAFYKKQQESAKDKCNDVLDTKFESFEEAMSSTDNKIRAQLNKGRTARDIVLEAIEMCSEAMRIFDSELSQLECALDLPTAHKGPVGQPLALGPNAKYSNNMLQKYVKRFLAAVAASYKGCMRTTATHAFVVVAGETNRNPDIPARPVLAFFVNHEHTAEIVAEGLTEISIDLQKYGYDDAVMHCPDGEYANMCRSNSEGGHTRMCTRYSYWAACKALAAAESREELLVLLVAKYQNR